MKLGPIWKMAKQAAMAWVDDYAQSMGAAIALGLCSVTHGRPWAPWLPFVALTHGDQDAQVPDN